MGAFFSLPWARGATYVPTTHTEHQQEKQQSSHDILTYDLPPRRSLPWEQPARDVEVEAQQDRAKHTSETALQNVTSSGLIPFDFNVPGSWPPTASQGTVGDPFVLDDDEDDVVVTHCRIATKPSADVLALFADGSFIGRRWGGAGVAYMKRGSWSGSAIALGVIGSSDEAEMRAIHEALKLAGELLRGEHRVLHVYSDSRSSLNTIHIARAFGRVRTAATHSAVVEMDRIIGRGYEVQLSWVKGHNISAGNEMADLLAGVASRKSRDGCVLGSRWDNPDLSEVALSERQLQKMAREVEIRTYLRRRTNEGNLKRTDEVNLRATNEGEVRRLGNAATVARRERRAARRARRAAEGASVDPPVERRDRKVKLRRKWTRLAAIAEAAA